MGQPSLPSANVVVKRKEAEKIIVPKFPNMSNLPQWRNAVSRNLACASSQADGKEVEWILATFEDGVTFDSLAQTGHDLFASLDIKLSAVVTAIIRDTPSARNLPDGLIAKRMQLSVRSEC